MPVPVLTVTRMREWEKASWEAGRKEREVIAEVGRLLARRILDLTAPGADILILAGKGHNGDDARLAEPHLRDRKVTVQRVTDPAQGLTGFDQWCRERPRRAAPARCLIAGASLPVLVIDGLFGIGLNRPLDDAWIRLLRAINESRLPLLSVDVPSGLNGETGQVEGEAVRADLTVTLGAPKAGLIRPSAWEYVNRLEVLPEIGLIPCPFDSELCWTLPEDFAGFPPRRRAATHKGSYGHVVIFAGSPGYHGAAVLAARAAARARPGLVTVVTLQATYVPIASQLQSAMVHVWQPGFQLPGAATALVFGPGLAAPDIPEGFRDQLRDFWADQPMPMVADASGLDWLPAGTFKRDAIRVITPHPGEAARLLGSAVSDIQSDRPAAVRQLSRRFGGCLVVLKGHQTLIGSAEGAQYLNSSGNPGLAQGGSGDLLAGLLGGLLAQAALAHEPVRAVRHGVWWHGAAADRLAGSLPHWTIEDLPGALGSLDGDINSADCRETAANLALRSAAVCGAPAAARGFG